MERLLGRHSWIDSILSLWRRRLPQRGNCFASPRIFSLLFALGLGLSLSLSACSSTEAPSGSASPGTSPTASQTVNIGYQKFGTLNILKARGGLEERLQPLGFTIQWTEFPAGPQLLEALNVGSIVFGHTGEAPPIFAQAAGAPLVYIGNEPASPASEAILIPQDSQIQSVAGLRGKRVVLNKGSNVHYLLVKAIEEAGLQLSDIEVVFLPPADARAAFEQGSVDAWVIWDPFFAAAEDAIGAKVLRDGEGLVANREFYLASRDFASQNPEAIAAILAEIQAVDQWS
ncbi:MAG: sulfonate ABC transporter substrate-binding protein, partial [Leptolyngbyaceae cyanobacterium RM2_2_4]|nr:sulfonate ABC transporter substrate-binding protein [Leptolyngbyaceae cyanobacterium RM2_2_4]